MKRTLSVLAVLSLPAMILPAAEPSSPEHSAPEKESEAPAHPERDAGEESEAPEGNAGAKSGDGVGHPFSWPFLGWEQMELRGGMTRATETTLDAGAKPSFAAIRESGLSKRERDRRAILALAGDHRVSFDFIETASSAHPYEPPRPYFSWATERAFILEDRPDFISIQHVLVMEFVDDEGEVRGPFTMKHWRQDWTYEDTEVLEFRGERTWETRTLDDAGGLWTQAVYQVDDSPRYEAVGRWDHRGGLSVFHTRPFWRPLPRREFSVRDDYNVLGGRHDITVTPTGWLHAQRNRKIVAEDGRIASVLANELGAVRYERISEPSLDPADDYWDSTGPFWHAVRAKWNEVAESRSSFTLRAAVEDRPMYVHLFELAGELETEELSDAERDEVIAEGVAVIDRFLSATPETDNTGE